MVKIGIGVLRDSLQTDILRPDLFGGIVVNKGGFDKFAADAADLNLGFLRYPGGTISEKGWVADGTASLSKGRIEFSDLAGSRADLAYDLTHPDLFSPKLLKGPDAPAGLGDLFELAVRQGSDVGVIIPIGRYIDGVDFSDPAQRAAAIAQFRADLGTFLERLDGGAFNGGDYPQAILLEIGNEIYGHPVEYALLAKVALQEIGRIDIPGTELGVALQMGRGSIDYAGLAACGYFDRFLDDDGNWTIPGLGDGPELPTCYADRITFIDTLMQEILGPELEAVGSLRHHVLGFDENVGHSGALYQQRAAIFESWRAAVMEAGGAEPEYYASAWTVDSSNTKQELFSAAASGNVLALFREFLQTGVDRAALWGIMGATDYYPKGPMVPVATLADAPGMSPHAALFALMAGKLPDTFAVETQTSARAVDVYAFADSRQVVLYVDVREAGPGGVTLDLSSFGSYGSVRVTIVGAEDGASSGFAEVTTHRLSARGGELVLPEMAAHSVVEVVLSDARAISFGPGRAEILRDMSEIVGREITPGMKIDLLALSNYEDRHIIGSVYDDRLLGGTGSDQFTGRGGDDVIWGRGGDDALFGSRGRDVLKGGAQNDRLDGGAGLDRLFGEAGADHLAGKGSSDLLSGGGGVDRLWGGGGDDSLSGGTGDDWLDGAAARDVLRGDAGRDVLIGGRGDDVLYGGGDADVFVFHPGDGSDRIRDFDADADLLNLRALDLAPRDLDLSSFWGGVRIGAGNVTIELMDVTLKEIAGETPWLL